MSRILRRPMFRGGPVDSRGTGITSGLDKPKRGLVNEPGGYAGEKTGMDFLKNALNKYVLGSKTQIGNTSPFSANTLPQKSSFEEMISNNQFGNQDPTKVKDVTIEDKIESYTPDNEVIREILERQSTYVDDDGVERSTTTGEEIIVPSKTIPQDGFLPTPGPEKGSAGVENKIDTSLLSDNPVLNNQNTANEELTLEEVRDSLGYKKARSRDLGDMFGRGAASFIGAESLSEGAKKFFEAEAASGPGRSEKIETAAGTFMLKDKAARSRDKAKVDLMRADTDYKIAAGKKKDIAESVLSVVKQGLPTDAKLASAIQDATSSNTGNKYKFKGVVNFKDLNSVLSSGKLKEGDTLIVKKVVKDPSTNVEKTQKKIIEITETGFEEIFNI
jgi:hypothetical protein